MAETPQAPNGDRLRKVLVRFVLTYLVMLILPIVFGSVAYRAASTALSQYAADQARESLRQTQVVVDSIVRRARDLAGSLTVNPTVRRFAFIEDPYDGRTVYRLVETLDEIKRLRVDDESIVDFYIHYSLSDVFVGARTAARGSAFYPDLVSYRDWDYPMWRSSLGLDRPVPTFLPARSARIFGQSVSVITYVQPFPYPIDPTGAIVILVDEAVVAELLDTSTVGDGLALLIDGAGTVIATSSGTGESMIAESPERFARTDDSNIMIAGREMLVSEVASPATGWRFISVQPVAAVMSELASIRVTTIAVVAVTLVVGIVLALFMSRRSVQPVRAMLRSNDALQRELDIQRPLLRQAFFERLLRGEYASESEIRELSEQLRLAIHENSEWGVCLAESLDDRLGDRAMTPLDHSRQQFRVAHVLRAVYQAPPVFVHEFGSRSIAVLYPTRTSSGDAVARFDPQHAHRVLATQYGLSTAWGVGTPRSRLVDLPHGFEEARVALNYGTSSESSPVCFYRDVPFERDSYAFPADIERRLSSMVSGGRRDEVDALLAQLILANVTGRHPESLVPRVFATHLVATALRIVESRVVRDPSVASSVRLELELRAEGDSEALCLAARDALLLLCDTVARQKRSHNDELIASIRRHLDEHFDDAGIGLAQVADRFKISDAYLSRFFKEQTGENFAAYLQSTRMRNASELLLATDLSVQEIASRVGFSSYTTFARTFRRVYGVAASEYRDRAERKRPERADSGESTP